MWNLVLLTDDNQFVFIHILMMRIIDWSISKPLLIGSNFLLYKDSSFCTAKQRNFDVKFQDFLNLDNDQFLPYANEFN